MKKNLLLLVSISLMLTALFSACSKEDSELRETDNNMSTELNELKTLFSELNKIPQEGIVFNRNTGLFRDNATGVIEDTSTLNTILAIKKSEKELRAITNQLEIIKRK